jgi:hypothetical protein
MWSADADVKKDLLQALLISADKYTGPALYHTADSKPVTPIFSVYCEWEGLKGSCSCKQFSVALAFALTMPTQELGLNIRLCSVRHQHEEQNTWISIWQYFTGQEAYRLAV